MSDLYDYPVVIEIPVAWGEMDSFKHVNNTHYFRYFESARVKYTEELKILDFMNDYAKGPILSETSAKFLAPVTYPDTLSVGIRSVTAKDGKLIQQYAIWSHEQSRMVTLGESTMLFFDYKIGKRCDIPEELALRMTKLEPSLSASLKSTQS
ncbi:MAG TPA: thioesterase [Oceanospirillales bacterium]|jgi:acyl-CoA thioester hydrolase|nr:thioesterase [Oleispira sp.]HCM04471.1 thioesterase [Oceanospirillales bacterium]|tara:strand:+ start:1962 stop:2417 length:456 start_codon:yes stop_codon:yes gene_type:complete